jgi:3-deoxy-D-manno-octulosonate 8-phosphate phosphatase (KDO 8-P phosphatase)
MTIGDNHHAPAGAAHTPGFIDARPQGDDAIDPWRDTLLGVPLAMWALRALRLVISPASICVAAPDHARALIESTGAAWLSPTDAEDAFDSALRSGSVLIASPFAPFCSPGTARRALDAGARELASEQAGPIERLRVRDGAELAEARAVALGLPPDHPAISGARAFAAAKLGTVRAVVCDVDGTLTDGKITYSGTRPGGIGSAEPGEPARAFDTRDGLATRQLIQSGVPVGILSSTLRGESSRQRMSMLGVEHVDIAHGHKGERFLKLCKDLGCPPEHVAYLGDDLNDAPAMDLAGMVVCPSDAHPGVRNRADLVLEAPGGRGALREFADALLDRLRIDGVLEPAEAARA